MRGSAVGLFLFDICEEIRLEELGSILGARRLGEGLKHAAAEQLFFERPPVVEEGQFPGEAQARVRVKYYDYGVLSVLFEFPFAGEWGDLITLSSRWISGTDLPSRAEEIAKERIARARPALVKPYGSWLSEDYFIFFMREIAGNPNAPQLLSSCGQQISQVVRGENAILSDDERRAGPLESLVAPPGLGQPVGIDEHQVSGSELGASLRIVGLGIDAQEHASRRHRLPCPPVSPQQRGLAAARISALR